MAKIRTIKPEFFRHEILQDLELEHQGAYPMMVFAGLWGHCDKLGRFEWRPRQLKLDILPFLHFDMAVTLDILVKSGLVVHYRIDGREYGEIPSFEKHQRISGKEAQEGGKHPAPTSEAIVKHQGSNGEADGKDKPLNPNDSEKGSNGEAEGASQVLLEGKGREGKGREMEGKGEVTVASPTVPRSPTGSRYPKDGNLTMEWMNEALTVRPDLTRAQVVAIYAEFKDHWIAKAGKDGVKLDWLATWRNWVRRERGSPGIKTNGHDKQAAVARSLNLVPQGNIIEGEAYHEISA